MDSKTAIARALTGLQKKTVYKSPGTLPSLELDAWPENASNDCSGFIYWCLRFESTPAGSRRVDNPLYKKVNNGWFDTSAIHADGKDVGGYFRELEFPAVGSLLVYPDKGGSEGHIGMVTAVTPGTAGIAGVEKVIHCSLGGWNKKGDAIQETAPDVWVKATSSIIVWYEGFSDVPAISTGEVLSCFLRPTVFSLWDAPPYLRSGGSSRQFGFGSLYDEFRNAGSTPMLPGPRKNR